MTFWQNLKIAKKILRSELKQNSIVSVNGCMYGRDNQPYKLNKKDKELTYYKICGQSFWELISGDKELYKKLHDHKDQIEADISEKLDWQELQGKKASRTRLSIHTNFDDITKWEDSFEWLLNQAEKFHKVFPKYIKLEEQNET